MRKQIFLQKDYINSTLLLYRVYCAGQAVNWKSKWKVKMFQNSL